MSIITEHSVIIEAELPQHDVNKKMAVFYNPLMQSNRSISILLLNAVSNHEMMIADPLAGSGIRSIRFLKELDQGKIRQIFVNDKKEGFSKIFENNLALNMIDKGKNIKISQQEAEIFLLTQKDDEHQGYFDYIDLDPFGSPNPFLSAAVNKIKRHGILAVTATDTAALTGTYPKVTERKYWSQSLKNFMMHELGLRILIRKVQLQGLQFDKALMPILSYHKDHYFRIFFVCSSSKDECDKIIKKHHYVLFNTKTLEFKASNYNYKKGFDYAGPLWIGPLFDSQLLTKMTKRAKESYSEEYKFLNLLEIESSSDVVGFYDLHALSKKYKTSIPKIGYALKKLKAVRTHFSDNGIKTKKTLKEIVKILRS